MAHELLFVDEVARVLRGTVSTGRYWLYTGRLPSLRPGRRRMIRRADLDVFLLSSAPKAARTSSFGPTTISDSNEVHRGHLGTERQTVEAPRTSRSRNARRVGEAAKKPADTKSANGTTRAAGPRSKSKPHGARANR